MLTAVKNGSCKGLEIYRSDWSNVQLSVISPLDLFVTKLQEVGGQAFLEITNFNTIWDWKFGFQELVQELYNIYRLSYLIIFIKFDVIFIKFSTTTLVRLIKFDMDHIKFDINHVKFDINHVKFNKMTSQLIKILF